jgi:hypothetical protein
MQDTSPGTGKYVTDKPGRLVEDTEKSTLQSEKGSNWESETQAGGIRKAFQ